MVEAAVGTAPAYDTEAETETNGTDDASADAGNLSAYGDQPDAGNAGVADHAPSITEVPGEDAPDADEANSEASSVEPSGARPASIAEG